MSWTEARRQRGDRAFRALWLGQSVSLLGSHVSLIVLPLIAAVVLGASVFQVGLLAALETLPYLVASLPAGLLADRVERRMLLVAADIGRAFVLLLIPVAFLTGQLSMLVLYVVALVNGTLSVIFDVAYQSYLPQIVPRHELVARNQRLELSGAGAQVLGPSLAGYLLAWLGGAVAVLIDAVTYLVSAAAVLASPRFRRPMARPFDPGRLSARLLSGVRLVASDRILRDLALSTATFNLASSCIFAVLIVFATRDVGVHPAAFGLIFGVGNVGFVVGALLVGRLSRRLGVGRTLIAGSWLGAMATILLPFAVGPFAVVALFGGRFIGAAGAAIFNVNAYSVRQERVPDEILGRVNATFRLVDWGTLPIGSLLGGTIGTLFGLRYALVFAALLGAFSLLFLARSPVRFLGGLGNEPTSTGRFLPAQARPAE